LAHPSASPRRDGAPGPVIGRLEEEHEQIADLLGRVDKALVALVAADGRRRRPRADAPWT